MMALALAYALATEWSEASPPRPVQTVAAASLIVADFQAMAMLAPMLVAPRVSNLADHVVTSEGDVLVIPEDAPAQIRVTGRSGQLYRVRLRFVNAPGWGLDGLNIFSSASGEVTDTGIAVMSDAGEDILTITGTLRRPYADPLTPAEDTSIRAAFGVHYE